MFHFKLRSWSNFSVRMSAKMNTAFNSPLKPRLLPQFLKLMHQTLHFLENATDKSKEINYAPAPMLYSSLYSARLSSSLVN